MRKKYGVLLFVLLTANSVWPEERPPLRQRFVRYMHLHKASKFIKRQYRDKHKRRAWLSIGGVGIAIFLLKRIELLRTFWRSKEKKRRDSPAAQSVTSSHEKQPQSNADSDRAVDLSVPPTPPPSRNDEPSRSDSEEKDDIGNDMQAPLGQDAFQQQLLAALPESTKSTENQGGTAVRKSDAEIAIEETLRQAAEMAKRLRKAGVKHIAQNAPEEEQQQNGTVILHSNDEEEDERTGDTALTPTHLKDIPDPVAPGAEGLEAALKAQGVRVAPPAPLMSVGGLMRADTASALPLIQAHMDRGVSLEQATHAALEELRQDPRIAVEEVTIQQTLEHAKKMMREQESAKDQLRAGIAQKDFELMFEAVMNGANLLNKTILTELIELTTNVRTLTPEQQRSFDCIAWELYEYHGVKLSTGTVAALAKRRPERPDIRKLSFEPPED